MLSDEQELKPGLISYAGLFLSMSAAVRSGQFGWLLGVARHRSTNSHKLTLGTFRVGSCDFLAPQAGCPRGDPAWIACVHARLRSKRGAWIPPLSAWRRKLHDDEDATQTRIFFPALRDIVCARQKSLLERRAVATRSHLGGIRPGSDRGFAESRRRSDRVATTTTPAGAARLGTPVCSPF